MAHGSLDLRQIILGVCAGSQLDIPTWLWKPLDENVLEVPLGDGFLYTGQPAAQVFSHHSGVVRVFARPHGRGRQCRLQCAYGFVGDSDIYFPPFPRSRFCPLPRLPHPQYAWIATRRALVLSVAKYRIANRSWLARSNAALLKGPSSSVQQPGCEREFSRNSSHVRTGIVCFFCRSD